MKQVNIHVVVKILKIIKTFGQDIYEGEITIKEADEYQADLLIEIMSFRKNTKPRSEERKREKEIVLQNMHNFF